MLSVNEQLMDQVVDVAYKASEAIMSVYQKSALSVEEKSDQSPLTEADLASHHIITSELAALDDETPIMSEESEPISFEERATWHQYWLVDPLDGTKEFIAKNPEFTVNIALIKNHRPVLGVVLVPPTGQCYVGGDGVGAKTKASKDGEWVSIQARPFEPSQSFTVVASRFHGHDKLKGLLERLKQGVGEFELKNIGSALKICLCAEGKADLYPRLAPTCEWDTAAAQAVLEAAGGEVVDDQGKVLRYNTKTSFLNPHFYVVADTTFDWRPHLFCHE